MAFLAPRDAARARPCRRARPGRAAACRRCRRCGTAGGARSSVASIGIARRARHVADQHALFLSRRLTSDDLPTLGRPTMATSISIRADRAQCRRLAPSDSAASSRVPRPESGRRCPLEPVDDLVEQVADARAVLGRDLERPARTRADRTPSPARARLSSVLLMASRTGQAGLPQLLRDRLVARRPGPRGRRRRRPGDRRPTMARWPCRTTSSCSGSSLAPNRPPVSDSWNAAPRQTTGRASESRVVPATGATMARREPVIRLNKRGLADVGAADEDDGGGLRRHSAVLHHLASALTA